MTMDALAMYFMGFQTGTQQFPHPSHFAVTAKLEGIDKAAPGNSRGYVFAHLADGNIVAPAEAERNGKGVPPLVGAQELRAAPIERQERNESWSFGALEAAAKRGVW